MNGRWWSCAVLAALSVTPAAASARTLDVEVWTDRGSDAVYQPGDALEVRVRASDDAYLIVYEIDAEGHVRLLHPFRGGSGFVERRRTYTVPPEQANVELVVEDGPVGQCYVVAIASRERFRELPWYLRPYDVQAEDVGYEGMRDDEEGITAEGRIVGDPFVAMERIRRRVVTSPEDGDAFATAYTSYYVHQEVRYPRYLCYDCHRPGRWAWWSGFDPYYTNCSVFDFRVNWGWGWGPAYWYGAVPYYVYVVRADCPTYYRPWCGTGHRFSSWDGWFRWNTLWGDHLVRYKTNPPPGYVPPSKFGDRTKFREGSATPPGFLVTDQRKGREGFRPRMISGHNQESKPGEVTSREERARGGRGGTVRRPWVERAPARTPRDRDDDPSSPSVRGDRERDSSPMPRAERAPRDHHPREEAPAWRPRESAPRQERPREEKQPQQAPPPRYEKQPPQQGPAEKPRESRGGESRRAPEGGRGGRSRG